VQATWHDLAREVTSRATSAANPLAAFSSIQPRHTALNLASPSTPNADRFVVHGSPFHQISMNWPVLLVLESQHCRFDPVIWPSFRASPVLISPPSSLCQCNEITTSAHRGRGRTERHGFSGQPAALSSRSTVIRTIRKPAWVKALRPAHGASISAVAVCWSWIAPQPVARRLHDAADIRPRRLNASLRDNKGECHDASDFAICQGREPCVMVDFLTQDCGNGKRFWIGCAHVGEPVGGGGGSDAPAHGTNGFS